MKLEIPSQSIEMRHLSYPLRRKLEGLTGGTVYNIITETLLDNVDAGTPINAADVAQIQLSIRNAADDIYNALLPVIDCLEAKIDETKCGVRIDALFGADTAQALTVVSPLSSTVIVWQNVQLNNDIFGYDDVGGIFTPTVAGYYKVQVYFNDQHTNSSARQALRVTSTNTSTPSDVDEYTGQTADRLYGHKIFYCNGTSDTFQIEMHNYDASVTMTYNSPLQGYHSSYMTAEYIGDSNSAF